MKIELRDIEFGGCNECKRGKLSKKEVGLVFPYDKVYSLSIGMMTIRLCPKCFEELEQKIKCLKDSGGESE